MNRASDQRVRSRERAREQCYQTNVVSDRVACIKRGCLWLIEFLQESFGSSWRAIPANYPYNLDSIWSGSAFFMLQWYVLTYFMVESSCYETWVARNHRQFEKKSYHHFTFEFCKRCRKKFVLDLFRDGFCICRGRFGNGMWKNWEVAALKYLCPMTSLPCSVECPNMPICVGLL